MAVGPHRAPATPPMPASAPRDRPEPAAWWRDPRGGWPLRLGILLVVSGLFHVAVWGVRGGSWEGPLSWRKPILFGLSAGLTAVSLGWAWAHLPKRRFDGVIAAAVAWALVVEVALIDLQTWRGVASHFNRATRFDSLLYDTLGILILFVSLAAADLAVRSFVQPVRMEPDMLLALRAGLLFLVVSCALGIWSSVHGDLAMARGLAPETFGRAGVTKFPHGAAIHALQWLPALAWAAARAGLPRSRRLWIVAAATAGTAAFLAYAILQTFTGRARVDASPGGLALAAAGAGLLVGAVLAVAAAAISRRPAPERGD